MAQLQSTPRVSAAAAAAAAAQKRWDRGSTPPLPLPAHTLGKRRPPTRDLLVDRPVVVGVVVAVPADEHNEEQICDGGDDGAGDGDLGAGGHGACRGRAGRGSAEYKSMKGLL